jgi:hypothetical protein
MKSSPLSEGHEQILPVSLARTLYLVLPGRGFEGDLVITTNHLYHFPHTHLDGRRIESAGLAAVLTMEGGDSGAPLLAALDNNLNAAEPRQTDTDVDITEALEAKLDGHLENEREERKEAFVSESLPLPMRFLKGGIRRLQLTKRGFSFFANSDNHEFIVRHPDILRRALKTGGYLTCYMFTLMESTKFEALKLTGL